jgi:hypothetical protein
MTNSGCIQIIYGYLIENGQFEKSALMKLLRNKTVEQKTLSASLRMTARHVTPAKVSDALARCSARH